MMNSAGTEGVKPTVLIADDDPSTRLLLRETISEWDYPVVEASDGEEAWDILKQDNSPQIVTVDWLMPRIDGLTLCRLAKNLVRPPYMILLTSMSGSENIIHALESGADDFLSKPLNHLELRSRLFLGQRIINFSNQLENAIKERKVEPERENIELSNVLGKMSEISFQIDNQWALLEQFLHKMGILRHDDKLVLQKVAQDIYVRQQKLAQELTNLGVLIEARDTSITHQKKLGAPKET